MQFFFVMLLTHAYNIAADIDRQDENGMLNHVRISYN